MTAAVGVLGLQDAVRGEFREVAKLLTDNGGKVYEVGVMLGMLGMLHEALLARAGC